MTRRFTFRNPSPGCRLMLVAAAFAVPGGIAGELMGLYFGEFAACAVTGALLGAFAGALMEAEPRSAQETNDELWQDRHDSLDDN